MFSVRPASGEGIRRGQKAVSCIVGGEAVVILICGGAEGRTSVYTFNESGTMLWAMIEAGRRAAELAERLRSEYRLSAQQAVADTRQFIVDLTEEGLIEPAQLMRGATA